MRARCCLSLEQGIQADRTLLVERSESPVNTCTEQALLRPEVIVGGREVDAGPARDLTQGGRGVAEVDEE